MSTNGYITLVQEKNAPSCIYEMYIDSKWACLGQIPAPSQNYEFWKDQMFVIGAVISAGFLGSITTAILIWCFYKRCQRRKKIKELIKDILQDDDDYGATIHGSTDIDVNDNVND
eukprot:UN00343